MIQELAVKKDVLGDGKKSAPVAKKGCSTAQVPVQ
jgi:hypothetical protein